MVKWIISKYRQMGNTGRKRSCLGLVGIDGWNGSKIHEKIFVLNSALQSILVKFRFSQSQ